MGGRRCWWRRRRTDGTYNQKPLNADLKLEISEGQLAAETVARMERLVGGNPVTEGQVLRFIEAKYGAKNLFYLPAHVAAQVCRRPADFIRAVQRFCEPDLPF